MPRPFITALPILALSAAAAFAEPADLADVHAPDQFAKAEPASETQSAIRELAAADPALSIRETEHGEVDAMVMLSDVLFAFGAADLDPGAEETLKSVAKKMHDLDGVTIVGHTDSIGADSENLALGMARAKAVRTWLIEEGGLDSEKLDVMSEGEKAPIAANAAPDGSDNAAGRALNRRVEFKFEEPASPTPAPKAGQELSQTFHPSRTAS